MVVLVSDGSAGSTVYQTPVNYVDGNETMQNLGRSVAMIDLNLDGISDLVVGAPYTTAGGLQEAGSVIIYLSEAGAAMSNVLVINGTGSDELFGWTVANVGDVNGDGNDDLAIGTPLADPSGVIDAGKITLLYPWVGFEGISNVTLSGSITGEELGYSIAAGGDINVDGIGDILAGAPYYSTATMTACGRAYVFYGGSPPDSVPDKTFTGEAAGAHLGWSVSGGGSVDADSDLDMIAGAPGQGNDGAAYLVRDIIKANPTVTIINGRSADENFSFSVSMIPDINGDTVTDLAIGAPSNNDNGSRSGAVYVLFGGSKFNTVTDVKLVGSPDEWLGWSVVAGDIHQDGVSDLLVGAPNSNLNSSSLGRAYAYFGGPSPSTNPNITLVPDPGASFFGASLAVGGNMSGDIAPEFAVGDPLFNVPGIPNAGRVYVYEGAHVVIPKNPIVRGHVYIPETTQGIQGFTITLESPSLEKSTTTDTAGYFEFIAVPGTFWINSSRPGFVSNSTSITLAMNDDITLPPFYPLKTPRVTGVVRDDLTSSLLQGATVAVYTGSTLVQSMITGSNGTYWFSLPEGLVPPEGFSTDISVVAWDSLRYASSFNLSLWRNVTVWQNFSLNKFPVVSGSVREALGLSAVRGALVQANQGPNILASTTTDIRGLYTLVATNATPGQALFVNVTATGYFRTNLSTVVYEDATYTLNFILQRDNTPPVSQLSPLPEYSTDAVVSISATASDANGIQEVQLWYSFGSSGSYTEYASDAASPFEFAFDASVAEGDGLYSFYSIAVDYAGNVEAEPTSNDTWTFADSHPPQLVINMPDQGHLYGSSTVTVQWSASDAASGLAGCVIELDSGSWINVGLLPLHVFSSVPDGPHNVTINATDRAGLSTALIVDFEVDTTSPVSMVVGLAPLVAEDTFQVNATASDANGIEEVGLWYRHGTSGPFALFGADAEAPYSFDVNASALDGDGIYEFYTTATDTAGNVEVPPTSGFNTTIVDTTPPTIAIDAPGLNSTVGSADVVVNWTGSDAASGIAGFEVRLDSGAWIPNGVMSNHTFANVSQGNHTVDVIASDLTGRTSMASTTFQVDTYPPKLSITSPANGSSFSGYGVTMTWTASDNGSGLAALMVSKDGMSWVEVDLTDREYVFSGLSMMVEGEYSLYVRAVDKGGLSTVDYVTVKMDRLPPSVQITSPLAGDKIGRTSVTITWLMSDDVSGLSVVRISVDGGPFMGIGTVTSYQLTDLAKGQHNVTIRVADNAGNSREASVTFTVSTGGGISTVMAAGIAIIVIVVVILAVLLMRRRKPALPSPPQQDKSKR